MKEWIPFQFLIRNPYLKISKGSVVTIDGEKFEVRRIDSIILLDDAVKDSNTVHVSARGIKLE